MENYSTKSGKKEPEIEKAKVVEKVVNGEVRTKKKGVMSEVKDIFVSEDAKNVKSYILLDILVPAVKKAISDIVSNGVDMLLYGESRSRSNKGASSRVSYESYSSRRDPRDRQPAARTRMGYSYDDVILDNRGEAEEVLTRMDEMIATYGIASVADLYDLVGISGAYTDNKYGWSNLSTAEIVRTRDGGYLIKMPKALPID